ncbi:MAG TPA: hypothetical protein VG963_22380 [Polyangiaceae bacterium]|nr:hypothetical protein [Polyangiaceae bacterium]
MFADFCHSWGLDYVIVHPWEWTRSREKDPRLRDSEVLDLWHAARALDEFAQDHRGRELLREVAREVLLGFTSALHCPGSYEEQQEDRQMIERLKEEALGTIFSKPGEPPQFARFYICRRKQVERKPEPLPDPWRDIRKATEEAKRAPRGFVRVEVANEAGNPVPRLRLEVLLTDGEVLTRFTDDHGQLQLEKWSRVVDRKSDQAATFAS